jgi:hypothetical protein
MRSAGFAAAELLNDAAFDAVSLVSAEYCEKELKAAV